MEPSSSSTSREPSDLLAAELIALQARTEAALKAVRQRQAIDEEAAEGSEAVFALIPDYVGKLRRVQSSMDSLAARTSQMRARCNTLVGVTDLER